MYNILEQAIIDAKALREAALKNAETAVLERYSDEVKSAIDVMLEAEVGFPEEEDEFVSPEEEDEVAPLAAAEGEELCACPDAEEEVEWELSLDDLKTMSAEMDPGEPMDQDALAGEFGAEAEEEDLMLEEEIELVFEDELDEINLPWSAAAGMDAAIAEMEREDLEALKVKIEAYILARQPSSRPARSHIETPRMAGVRMAGVTAESKLKEISLPWSAAAGMDAAIAELELEELEALKAKVEAYLKRMPPAEGPPGERIETPRMGGVGMAGVTAESIDEDIELDEDMVREIVEELVVDISPQKSGWAGTPASAMAHAEEQELARRSGTAAKEEIEALQDAGERLSVQESKKLEDENRKLKELIYAMKGKLDETVLSNAKLLYTNQTLTSASLNERQKNRIVESIQNADSVEEAKVIFETLQSAAGPSTRKAPKSLNEAISRPSLTVSRRRGEISKHESVVKDRFQTLAGIKNK